MQSNGRSRPDIHTWTAHPATGCAPATACSLARHNPSGLLYNIHSHPSVQPVSVTHSPCVFLLERGGGRHCIRRKHCRWHPARRYFRHEQVVEQRARASQCEGLSAGFNPRPSMRVSAAVQLALLSASSLPSVSPSLCVCLSSRSLQSPLVLVVMMKSKELKTKISHAHSLILSPVARVM